MISKISYFLFYSILIEFVLGGGGRLIDFGPVSLRMVLFSLALVLTLIHVIYGARLHKKYLQLLLVFTLTLIVGVSVALVQGNTITLIWEDVKPLLFFYLLPFFVLTIKTENDLRRISQVIYTAATGMAFAFLTILTLFVTNTIQFLDFYYFTITTEEFFFRGEISFFYKGFIYLCVGFLFVHLVGGKKIQWSLIILLLATVLSFTRGLIFALSLCYLVYYLFLNLNYIKTLAAGLFCFVILFYGKTVYSLISEKLYSTILAEGTSLPENQKEKLLGDRQFSDNERKLQLRQVYDATTPTSVIWGHGFGQGVKSRPVHMEISYLEIFHKQGLVGLACWAFIFFNLISNFRSSAQVNPEFRNAFFLSALFVFFQSLTNQYINNPIGLGMILISLVSLGVLSTKND